MTDKTFDAAMVDAGMMSHAEYVGVYAPPVAPVRDATSKLQLWAAYNEFIADYCERGEKCKATRDEAHKVADSLVGMGKTFAAYANAAGLSTSDIDEMIDLLVWEHEGSAAVVAWAVAVEMGSVG